MLFGALSAAVILFLLAEVCCRLWFRHQNYFVHRRWERMELAIDRETLPSLEPVIRFEVNGEGERGDPLPKQRDGLYRVLVAGGSAVECGLLDQESAWPAVIQRLLNKPGPLRLLGARRVHVGNIGRSYTPLDTVHLILKRVLPRYRKLDLLILMTGLSDAVAWMEQKTPAPFHGMPLPDSEIFSENPGERFLWRSRKWAIRRVCGNWWRRFARPVRTRQHAGRQLGELRRRRNEATEWLHAFPGTAPMLDYLEKNLRRSIAAARAKAARVILVRQPWLDKELTPQEEAALWNCCSGHLSMESPQRAYYTHSAVRGLLKQVDARVARVAAELGVEQVSLMPSLEPSLDTFYDLMHFTPLGALNVARQVTAAILAPRHRKDVEAAAVETA
jgi:hypothetical protein